MYSQWVYLLSAGIVILLWLVVLGFVIYFISLLIKALKKYLSSSEIRKEKKNIAISLGEILKRARIEKNMSQEFVSETLGVSRQSISKWENGVSDPSTSNLISLSKLYNIQLDDLLDSIRK